MKVLRYNNLWKMSYGIDVGNVRKIKALLGILGGKSKTYDQIMDMPDA